MVFNYIWLVVSTHLKNISQPGNLLQIWVKIKNIRNHLLDIYIYLYSYIYVNSGILLPSTHHENSLLYHLGSPFSRAWAAIALEIQRTTRRRFGAQYRGTRASLDWQRRMDVPNWQTKQRKTQVHLWKFQGCEQRTLVMSYLFLKLHQAISYVY